MNVCKWHLCKQPAKRVYCSRKCKNKFGVDKRRKMLKEQAIEYAGGECQHCGYNRCNWALTFHHIDPATKLFGVGSGYTKSWDKIRNEVDKCILLCQNCHHEHHAKEHGWLPG